MHIYYCYCYCYYLPMPTYFMPILFNLTLLFPFILLATILGPALTINLCFLEIPTESKRRIFLKSAVSSSVDQNSCKTNKLSWNSLMRSASQLLLAVCVRDFCLYVKVTVRNIHFFQIYLFIDNASRLVDVIELRGLS